MAANKKVVAKPTPRKPLTGKAMNERIAAVVSKDKAMLPDPTTKPGKKFYKSASGKPLKDAAVKTSRAMKARRGK